MIVGQVFKILQLDKLGESTTEDHKQRQKNDRSVL
jgi:hypothetical protein